MPSPSNQQSWARGAEAAIRPGEPPLEPFTHFVLFRPVPFFVIISNKIFLFLFIHIYGYPMINCVGAPEE